MRLVFGVIKHQFPVIWQCRDNELDRHCQSDPRHRSHRVHICSGFIDLVSFQVERERQ